MGFACVACADPLLRNCCLQWEGLTNPRVPMLFHGIEGKDEQEGNSPSWFNADEAVQVLRYIESLLRMRGSGLQQEHIGKTGIGSDRNLWKQASEEKAKIRKDKSDRSQPKPFHLLHFHMMDMGANRTI